MGFWQTGYMEFHEYSGVGDYHYEPSPPEYPCTQCSEIFSTVDALRKHRFEDHPSNRPTLILRGRELGSHPVRITTPLQDSDIVLENCDRAKLDDEWIGPSKLPTVIANFSHGVHRLTLVGGEISSEFTFDLRIATECDLIGIEQAFMRMAAARSLDIRAIDEFISAAKKFASAIGYCDGICAYLYGVLAKERSDDSSLPYDGYVGKYSKAAEELAVYDRLLARTISGLIKFHFNHFADASCLAKGSRIGFAASRYDAWLRGLIVENQRARPTTVPTTSPEGLVSDWDTEQITRWVVTDIKALAQYTSDMEAFLARDISDYDRLKAKVLLAETYISIGDAASALRHAKSLRNLAAVEEWAERLIRTLTRDKHKGTPD